MGNDQSSPAAQDKKATAKLVANLSSEVVGGGRESLPAPQEVESKTVIPSATIPDLEEDAVLVEEPRLIESSDEEFDEEETDDDEEEEEESDDEEDEEYDEFLLERLRILEDARSLKNVANHFLHPEKPVAPSLGVRCYFDRASAPDRLDADEAEEIARTLEDAAALKKGAVRYAHPERGVETDDDAATARCYFDRPSAPERLDAEEAEEIARSLSDASRLKDLATDYAHPEVGVTASDPAAKARNYFSRPSAGEYEEEEVDADRDDILEDMAALKSVALQYLHPEAPVVTSPESFGRNYFSRASAPEHEEEDVDADRDDVLEDAAELRKLAVRFAHPERAVVAEDPAAFGRNYFGRASAPQEEEVEDSEERAAALADALALRKLAEDYAHPEVGVKTSDPAAFGRNFFSRPSAGEYEEEDVDADRDDILEDIAALKKLATDFAHPEKPVKTSDATVFGRNFFNRATAPDTEEEDIDAERDDVLEDVLALKKLASDYAHPEKPVEVDAAAFGRNYFGPEQDEDAEERAAALADAKALKKLAVDYSHPEAGGTTTDSAAFGRNFFSRPSAGEYEEEDVDADRDDVLEDMAALKKLASDYAHPEKPVETTDATVFGRNYFHRASAPDTEEEDIDAERDDVLEDVLALKKLASDYAHPEKPVKVDPAAFGRNYFGPQEEVEDAEERAAALADALALKKLAVDYAHPEVGVATTDATAFGRNYFTRHSAPAHEDAEEAEEVLADAHALAKLARDYAHPEAGVGAADATAAARCYYSRHSSPTHNDLLITARSSAAKPEARVSAVGPLPPSATERRQGQGSKKAAEKKKGGGDDDLPRVSSSHMLFGMAE